MFALEDAPWVARALGTTLRITVEEGTLHQLKELKPSAQRDALYGEECGTVGAHILFSWQSLADGTGRSIGHFDVLYPKQCSNALLL